MAKRINEREALFIAHYLVSHNATESALKAGYSPKSSAKIGSQLMHKPKIINAIQCHEAKRIDAISKESFIDMAVSDYKKLELTEANKPRFLDIAGKALGYIGAGNDRPNQTLNVLNVQLTGKESRDELLANVRRLLMDNIQP